MNRDTLQTLQQHRQAKVPVVLATNLVSHEQVLISPETPARDEGLQAAATSAIRSDRSTVYTTSDGTDWFLNVYNPPLRLIVVGAVHIAQPLARMGNIAGFAVTVVDPRESFASDTRFPDVTLSTEWPDQALAALDIDARTAIVTLTHDPKLDDPALEVALKSQAFYIGSLGSKKTHAARLERLTGKGFSVEEQARIHGPVGLNIGGKSPAEIAISILAEVTSVLRKAGA